MRKVMTLYGYYRQNFFWQNYGPSTQSFYADYTGTIQGQAEYDRMAGSDSYVSYGGNILSDSTGNHQSSGLYSAATGGDSLISADSPGSFNAHATFTVGSSSGASAMGAGASNSASSSAQGSLTNPHQ